MTKKTQVDGRNETKNMKFHRNKWISKTFFPCLKGSSDNCHDYTSLQAFVNLLVLNDTMQQLFVLWIYNERMFSKS